MLKVTLLVSLRARIQVHVCVPACTCPSLLPPAAVSVLCPVVLSYYILGALKFGVIM